MAAPRHQSATRPTARDHVIALNADEAECLLGLAHRGLDRLENRIATGTDPAEAQLHLEAALLRSLIRDLAGPPARTTQSRDVVTTAADEAARRMREVAIAAAIASRLGDNDPGTALALWLAIEEEAQAAFADLHHSIDDAPQPAR